MRALLAGSALWPTSRRPKQSVPLIILAKEAETCFNDTFDLIKAVVCLLFRDLETGVK